MGWKEEALTKFWTWETWGTQTRRRDHKGCPAPCGRLRRTHSRVEAGHLKLQTSCRDGPAKKEGRRTYARYQKIHSFKNQPQLRSTRAQRGSLVEPRPS